MDSTAAARQEDRHFLEKLRALRTPRHALRNNTKPSSTPLSQVDGVDEGSSDSQDHKFNVEQTSSVAAVVATPLESAAVSAAIKSEVKDDPIDFTRKRPTGGGGGGNEVVSKKPKFGDLSNVKLETMQNDHFGNATQDHHIKKEIELIPESSAVVPPKNEMELGPDDRQEQKADVAGGNSVRRSARLRKFEDDRKRKQAETAQNERLLDEQVGAVGDLDEEDEDASPAPKKYIRRKRRTKSKEQTQESQVPEYIITQMRRVKEWVDSIRPQRPPSPSSNFEASYSEGKPDTQDQSMDRLLYSLDPLMRDIRAQRKLEEKLPNRTQIETPRLRVPLAEKTLGPSGTVVFYECAHLNHISAEGHSDCDQRCVVRSKLTKMPSLDFCAQPLYFVNSRFCRVELPQHLDRDLLDVSKPSPQLGWRGVLVEMLHSYSSDAEERRMKELSCKNSRYRTEPTSLRLKVMKVEDFAVIQESTDFPITLLMHFYGSLKSKVTKCVEFWVTPKRAILLNNVWRTWPDGTSSKVPHTEALMTVHILQQFGVPVVPARDAEELKALPDNFPIDLPPFLTQTKPLDIYSKHVNCRHLETNAHVASLSDSSASSDPGYHD